MIEPVRSRLPPGVRLDNRAGPVMRGIRAACRMVIRSLAIGGLRIEGLETVPSTGPVLVCCNHLSNLDPLVLVGFYPRVTHAMTKAELFGNPVARAVLTRSNCFPVNRGGLDRAAVRGALAVLDTGGALLVFPEGTRAPTVGLRAPEAGAGWLARQSGALVQPCGIWGTERAWPPGQRLPRRGRIMLRLGRPFHPQATDPRAAAVEVMLAIASLLPPEYRGRFA